jgi:cysteinyl-tRNA synthetase
MAKSTGNNILPNELFDGSTKLLSKAFTPDVARFFMLQAHYRSMLDFSDDALLAAEKGYARLKEGINRIGQLPESQKSSASLDDYIASFYRAMDDDFNSPVLIAALFEAIKLVHLVEKGTETLTKEDIQKLQETVHAFVHDVLGLTLASNNEQNSYLDRALDVLIELREQARANKDFVTSDQIRDQLLAKGIQLKDDKDGTSYTLLS